MRLFDGIVQRIGALDLTGDEHRDFVREFDALLKRWEPPRPRKPVEAWDVICNLQQRIEEIERQLREVGAPWQQWRLTNRESKS